MDTAKQEKLNKFFEDKNLADIVYQELLKSFLKVRNYTDVNTLAASRLSIDYFQEGWRELSKWKREESSKGQDISQVGL